MSVITDIQDNGRDNIVSCIKIGPESHVRHKGCAAYQWYLFNDFSIVPITAVRFLTAIYFYTELKIYLFESNYLCNIQYSSIFQLRFKVFNI